MRDVVKKRYHIIGKVANKYWKTSHKFGIRGELLHIDKETGTDFWRRSIENKMLNLQYTFQGEEGLTTEETRKGKVIIRFQDIKCHLIFDIKLDGKLTRKARFVAGGHMNYPPASLTYYNVVSRDIVQIYFTLAALNGLDIWAFDTGNVYLNEKCRENIWKIQYQIWKLQKETYDSNNGSVWIEVK